MALDKKAKQLPKGITYREDGRYMGRFKYQGEPFTVYDSDLKAVKKKLADLKYEVEHEIYAKEQNITVTSWFAVWISEYKQHAVKSGTITSYTDCFIQYIKPEPGIKKLKNVRTEHVQSLYNKMVEKGYTKSTISLTSIVLKSMYNQAVKNDIVQKNSVSKATLPKLQKNRDKRVLTVTEQKLFLEYVEESLYHNTYKLALFTGMRSGELRA